MTAQLRVAAACTAQMPEISEDPLLIFTLRGFQQVLLLKSITVFHQRLALALGLTAHAAYRLQCTTRRAPADPRPLPRRAIGRNRPHRASYRENQVDAELCE